MQCQESKKILDAYVDHEVDLIQSVALEEHLAGCADCSKNLESRRALKDAIQGSNLRYTAPPELMKGVRKSLGLPAKEAPSWRWQWFKAASVGFAAATALCLVVAAILLYQFRTPPERQLAALAVNEHIRSMLDEGNHLLDVVSSNQHVVKPWLSSKISFSPKVTDFTDKGFPLAGGRLDYLDHQEAAALVYKRYQHVINVFIYPAPGSSGQNVYQERGYNVIYWKRDGMQYYVVSDLNVTELEQFAGMLKE